jgi:hypothetical protein
LRTQNYFMEKKITSYTVIRMLNPVQLAESVNEYIKNGWQPFGPLSTVVVRADESGQLTDQGRNSVLHTQAMVKYVSVKVSDVKVVD